MPSLQVSAIVAASMVAAASAAKPMKIPMVKKRRVGKPHKWAKYLSKGGSSSVPLTGHDGEDYWTGAIGIGTPAQIFGIDFDTGSSDLWIPFHLCEGCPKECKSMDDDASSTYKRIRTIPPFIIAYGSGEAVGYIAQDVVQFGNYSFPTQQYAEMYLAHGQIGCGILGLGFTPLDEGITPWFQNMMASDPNFEAVFAFYLPASTTNTTGELVIGGVQPEHFHGKLVASPVVDNVKIGYWITTFDSIAVGSTVTVTQQLCILDSGTTVMLMGSETVDVLKKQLGSNAGSCSAVASKGPAMNFQVAGANFSVPASEYQYQLSTTDCSGIVAEPINVEGTKLYLLGDTFIRIVYTVFDVKNSQLKFAYANNNKGAF